MDTLQAGQNLGPYRIIGQVGQGGMATVYRAYHAAMDRYVAVKVLPSQLAENPEFVSRFRQEARTIAKLEHARILPVYDYGEDGSLTYLVMRYLDAGTLKERMSRVPMPLTQVDRLFTQLAEALEYAHAQGVVHRDLKPSNALVDSQNNLFLTDFGIAKLLEGGAQLTTTGAMIGTPAYMSPEQAQGDKVDQRTDIYSLGVILYEMTTGRVPFEAETPLAVVLKQIGAPLPLPSTVMANFSPAIERVLLKALAKNPTDRYATVTDFLAAWKRALAELETVQAAAPATAEVQAVLPTVAVKPAPETMRATPPATPVSAPPAPAKKFPLGLALGGGALAVIALIVAGVFFLRPGATPPQATPTLAASINTENFTWQSWAASNFVTTLAAHEGRLYAGSLGSLTVWDMASGEMLKQYTTANGLPNPQVNALWVSENGGLWVGTSDGLARLNPAADEWVIYENADGLESDYVTALARAGNSLVVGTKYGPDGGGLYLLNEDNAWQTFPNFPSLNDNAQALEQGKLSVSINALLPAAENELWVGTEVGLGRYNAEADEWTRFSTADGLPSNYILSLFVGQNGTLWVGTEQGVARFDGTRFVAVEQGPSVGINGITQDAEKRLYFAGNGGLWRLDVPNADWQEFSQGTGDLTVYGVYDGLAVDDKLYFGSDGGGPVVYDGEEFDYLYNEDSPVSYAMNRILRAPNDELWFVRTGGTYPDRYSLSEGRWREYVEPPCGCEPLAFDANGNWWANEWPNVFHIFAPNGADKRFGPEQGLLEESYVWDVAFAPDGSAWLGTETGVAHFNGERIDQIIRAADAGFASDSVRDVFVASDGSLGIATQPTETGPGTVSRFYEGNWEHFTAGQGFSSGFSYATDFAEDANGQIWISTAGDWVYRFVDGAWEQVKGELPSAYVSAISRAPDGSLWFATDTGAARLNGDEWEVFAQGEDELISRFVNDIYVEPNGAVWFSTEAGVSRWGP